MNILSISLILIYLMLLLLLSAFFVKKALNSYEEYAFCGKKLTISFVIFTYLGTWIGGGTIIGLAGSAYVNGAYQYWIFASSCLVGFPFAVFFICKIRYLRLRSIGDLFALRYPKYRQIIRLPVSLSIILRNVTMIGIQFTALGYMITYLVPTMDKNIAILVTFIFITGYTSLSGLWAVVSTDVFQGFLQIVGLVILLFLSVEINGGLANVFDFYDSMGTDYKMKLLGGEMSFRTFLSYIFCFGVFTLMGDQSDWERLYSCKTDKTAFWGYLIPLTITLIILLIPAYIGVFQGVLIKEPVGQEVIIYWFLFEKAGFWLSVFILVTLLSAIMSSADSYIIASGTILSHEIIKGFLNKEANDRELIFWSRIGAVTSGAIGFAFAINIHGIILLWLSGLAISTIVLLPEYLMIWFSKRMNTEGALFGIAAGGLFCMGLILSGGTFQFYNILFGCALNITAAYIGSTFGKKPDPYIENPTYYWGKELSAVPNIPGKCNR